MKSMKSVKTVSMLVVIVFCAVFIPLRAAAVVSLKSGMPSPKSAVLDTSALNDLTSHASNMRPMFSTPSTSYLTKNADGTFSKVEITLPDIADESLYGLSRAELAATGRISIETFNKEGDILSTKTPDFELPYLGAVMFGENYNYIAFGGSAVARFTEDYDEAAAANENSYYEVRQRLTERGMITEYAILDFKSEIVRIVKYDKNWNRAGSVSVSAEQLQSISAFAYLDFYSSAADMTENGDKLILHGARARIDGHQSNFLVVINPNTMSADFIGGGDYSHHISHTFNEYVMFDDDSIILVNHTDGGARGVRVQKGKYEELEDLFAFQRNNMMMVAGARGDNYTGMTLGGFEVSRANYLAAANRVPYENYTHSRYNLNDFSRSVYVYALKREMSLYNANVETTLIADYANMGSSTVRTMTEGVYFGRDTVPGTPRLVSNGDNTFIVYWQEIHLSYPERNLWMSGASGIQQVEGDVVAQTIDGNGKPIGEAKRYYDVNDFYREFLGTALPGDKTPVSGASDWASDGIKRAAAKNFIDRPVDDYTKNITREEFCGVAINWLEFQLDAGIDAIVQNRGIEVPKMPFYDVVNYNIHNAYALGVVNGTRQPTPDEYGLFEPEGLITREQAAVMIRNACLAAGMDVSNTEDAGFSDIDDASSWAVDAINFCMNNGIMRGTSTSELLFSPKDTYTWEQSLITFDNIDMDIVFDLSDTSLSGEDALLYGQFFINVNGEPSEYRGERRAGEKFVKEHNMFMHMYNAGRGPNYYDDDLTIDGTWLHIDDITKYYVAQVRWDEAANTLFITFEQGW